jgi:hypothetical protein
MLTVAPLSVWLMGVLGIAVVLASVLRIVVLEHATRGPIYLGEAGPAERPRIAA